MWLLDSLAELVGLVAVLELGKPERHIRVQDSRSAGTVRLLSMKLNTNDHSPCNRSLGMVARSCIDLDAAVAHSVWVCCWRNVLASGQLLRF